MNTAVAVLTRELRERSRIFLVAAAVVFIPYIAAWVPSVRGQRVDAINTLGAGAAVVYGLSLALALGASILGRELTEKRLSFYFVKPLSPLSLWAGKAVAAVAAMLGAMAIIAFPTVLVWEKFWTRQSLGMMAGVVFLCVAVFLASHTISTMVRSRSGVIAIDLVCAAAVAFFSFLLFRQLLAGGAREAAAAMGKAGLLAVVALLAVAPVWQLSRGRTDVRRSHIALSKFLWPALAAVLLVAAAYVGWVVTAPLSSIREFGSIEQTPKGDWVMVSGESNRAGYFTSYLVNTRTGDHVRTQVAPWWGEATSRDGSTLVTTELAELYPRRMLVNLRVGPFGDRDKSRVIELSDRMEQAALSHDGSRIAVATPRTIRVYETNSGRMSMAAKFDHNVTRMYFVSPSVVRVHGRVQGGEAIHELDLVKRSLVKTGQVSTGGTWNSASEDGSRLFLRKEATLVDGRTGAPIAKSPVQPVSYLAGAVLNDGRLAVIAKDGLHLYDRDARELKTIPLPPAEKLGIRAQVGDSKLILGAGTTTMVVDLESGKVGPVLQGVRGPMTAWTELRLARFAEDALIAGTDANEKLVLWDVRTGEKRTAG